MAIVMTNEYARKLSTEALENRLKKTPFNEVISRELNKRASKVFKCEIRAKIRLEKEQEKYFKRAIIGSKNESYATEEEMIDGFKCTYNDLSDSEKKIFNVL